jgi:hypothetical protein
MLSVALCEHRLEEKSEPLGMMSQGHGLSQDENETYRQAQQYMIAVWDAGR